jgi:VWFA-related protein
MAPFAAQSPQPAPTAPTLKVYSRETIVDVTVTDSKGKPVHGLTQSDFTVKEDNKPQPIRSFEEFGSAAPTPAQPLPKLPPNVYTNLQPPAVTGATNILLLDFLNTAPLLSPACCGVTDPANTDVTKMGAEDLRLAARAEQLVKQEAMKYLSTLSPGTRVAVMGLSSNLRLLQGFTSDPALLRAAVDSMAPYLDGRADNGPQLCSEMDTRIHSTLEVLNQIAADSSAIKGRKNLLWFSIGVPALVDPAQRPTCLPDYQSELDKTHGLLMAAQVALFPVDPRGVPPIPIYIHPLQIPSFEQQVGTEQLALEAWAEATGGAAFYNSNDIAGEISKAVDKGSDYYTISYVPPGMKYDNAHHTIKVTVDKPDLHLVYRQTYDAVDPATIKPAPGLTLAAALPEAGPHPDPEAAMRLAMGRSMPTSQQLLFDVQVEPTTEPAKPTDPAVFGMFDPKLKSKPLTRYGFQFAIPGRQIAFTDGPNATRHASLEFDLAAYDADGKLISSLSQTVNLPLTAGQAAQLAHSPFRFFQQLDLPSGPLFLRLGILDRTSSKIGTLEIPLTIPRK